MFERESRRGAGTWKNMRVAIKTILFQASTSIESEPVLREACIALRMSHANLVSTYHADVRPLSSPGHQLGCACQMYLIQEFCDAGTLYSGLANACFHPNGHARKVSFALRVQYKNRSKHADTDINWYIN